MTKTDNKRGNRENPRIFKVYHESLVIILLLVLNFVFFLRLFIPEKSVFMIPDFGESDVLHVNLPLKKFLSENLKNNSWPLWTDSLAGGFPVLAESQIGTFYLPNLLLFKFLPFIEAFNLNLALSFLIAGVGMYLFCRKIRLGILASFYTSVIFSYSAYFSVHLNHFNLLQAASLIPVILYAFSRFFKNRNILNLVFASFLLSQQIFAGYFYITFITLIALAVLHVKFNLKNLMYFLIPCIFAFFLGAVQILPTLELVSFSQRGSGLPYDTVTSNSYPPLHLLSFFNPYIFGNPGLGSYPRFSRDWGIFWENTAYMGIIPLILALSSIYFIKIRRVRIFWLLSVSAILLLLGRSSPLYFIFSVFPFNLFRNTSRYIILLSISLSVLSGFTLDRILFFLRNQKIKLIVAGVALMFFLFDGFRFSYNYPPLSPGEVWLSPPEILKIINRDSRIKSYSQEYAWNGIFLKKGWSDISEFYPFTNSLFANQNLMFGIDAFAVNTGGLVPRRVGIWQQMSQDITYDHDEKSMKLNPLAGISLDIWGVDTLISSYKIDDDKWLKIGEYPGDGTQVFGIYSNPEVRKPAYFAQSAKTVNSLEELYSYLPGLSPSEVITENDKDFSFDREAEYSLEKVSGSGLRETYRIKAGKPGMLVLNRTHYSGWEYLLDGKEIDAEIVNLNQPAVIIPEGIHTLEYEFSGRSFNAGKILSMASGLTAFSTVFLSASGFFQKRKGIRLRGNRF